MYRCAKGIVTLALALGPLVCHGDSSYKETTQMTGGQLIDSLKNIPFMGKQMKSLTDPVTTTTMVHGNQKAVVTSQSTEIYDLDKQEIIHIDTVKKQYSVDTFDDMRKMMARMPDAIKQAQAATVQPQAPQAQAPASNLQYSFSVSVNRYGRAAGGKRSKREAADSDVDDDCDRPEPTGHERNVHSDLGDLDDTGYARRDERRAGLRYTLCAGADVRGGHVGVLEHAW